MTYTNVLFSHDEGSKTSKKYESTRVALKAAKRHLTGKLKTQHFKFAVVRTPDGEARYFYNADEIYIEPKKQSSGDFYSSADWRKLRYDFLQTTAKVCNLCGCKDSPEIEWHVDHIKCRFLYPELKLNFDNLQLLCKDCNIGKGTDEYLD